MKSMYHWATRQVHTKYATTIFMLLVFIEGFIFVPVSMLLSLYCLEKRHNAFWYATLATLASLFGGCLGYYIGFTLWQSLGQLIIHHVISPQVFANLVMHYRHNQTWAILVVGFLPLPYKAITLTAGFCKLPFIPFLMCAVVSRATRFYIIAGALYYWGEQIQQILDRYFYYLVLLGVCVLATSWYLLH